MKKFTTALAVSMLLMSALVLYGCGPNRNDGDMANNQPENNNAVTAPEIADNSTAAQDGTISGGNYTAADNASNSGTENGTISANNANSSISADDIANAVDDAVDNIANSAANGVNNGVNTNGTAN